MKKILTIIIVIVCLTSCKKHIIGDTIPCRLGFPSFMDYYYIPSAPKVTIKDNCKAYLMPYTIGKTDSYLIINCIDSARIYECYEDTPTDKRIFATYAKTFGDTLASEEHKIDNQYYASVMPLTAIDVITEQKYDTQHPAKSNINDIVYIHTDRDNEKLLTEQWLQSLDRRIDSISAIRPINMLNDVFYLHFIKQPDNPGTYTFTISMDFGADPVTGDTIEFAPLVVDFEFKP